MNTTAAPDSTPAQLLLWPLVFERLACAMAMMAFIALAPPLGRELGLADWQVGAVVSVGSLTWMLFAAYWGRASDRLGRRRVLLTGLAGFVMSFIGLCAFIGIALAGSVSALAAFAGLIVWRGLAGVFYAGVLPSSIALIAGHTLPAERAGRMALLGVASGAGMALGPAIAGLLAPAGLAIPLLLLALLPVLALVLLWRYLPAEAPAAFMNRPKFKFTDKRLRGVIMTALAAMISVTMAQICVGFYAIDRLGLGVEAGARVAGMALACVGVGLLLSQLLVRYLRWAPKPLLLRGTLLGAAGFGLAIAASSPIWLCASYLLAAIGMGWVWPSLNALATSLVAPGEQGAAAGTVSAAQALGAVVGPLAGSWLYGLNMLLPYVLIAVVLMFAAAGPIRRLPARLANAGTSAT